MAGTRIGQQQLSEAVQDLSTQVAALTSPGPAFTDPVTKFALSPGPDSGHVQIAFRVAALPGISQVQIHRSATRDFGTSIHLTQFDAAGISPEQDVNYADINAQIAGKKTFYWLVINPLNTNNAPIVHPPQSIIAPP